MREQEGKTVRGSRHLAAAAADVMLTENTQNLLMHSLRNDSMGQ